MEEKQVRIIFCYKGWERTVHILVGIGVYLLSSHESFGEVFVILEEFSSDRWK